MFRLKLKDKEELARKRWSGMRWKRISDRQTAFGKALKQQRGWDWIMAQGGKGRTGRGFTGCDQHFDLILRAVGSCGGCSAAEWS